MTSKFLSKVARLGSVDTAKYRYICADCGDHSEIRRLPLAALDTTEALTGWETVRSIERIPRREYAVNYNLPEWRFPNTPELAARGQYCPEIWEDSDLADWYDSWESAFAAAESRIQEDDVSIVRITTFVDGEADDSRELRKDEDGDISEYDSQGNILWL